VPLRCPICHDAHEDAAYAMPCGHQFCLGCIMHWTDRKPVCPVCSRTILIVKFSVREEDDYLQCLNATERRFVYICISALFIKKKFKRKASCTLIRARVSNQECQVLF
uniref:RING-type E3 ubiquitin transferase n=1 Tax=Serinus canaria TaxID=9135 RepID=A0A8C9ND88_SERCA